MTPHNSAKNGEIAESVLMPGDPLRAKHIAENYLEDVVCYNQIRNAFGFTGTYRGKRISVQASGMGIPSFSIYVNELFEFYGCKNVVRVGTCGAVHPEVKVRDTIIATGACTDSAINRNNFHGHDYAAVANFELMRAVADTAAVMQIPIHFGLVFSSDLFYSDKPHDWELWAKYGVLAVEMEAVALYTIAAKYHARGLCMVTVSDHVLSSEQITAEERQRGSDDMVRLALESLLDFS